jgi:hypothetical protein
MRRRASMSSVAMTFVVAMLALPATAVARRGGCRVPSLLHLSVRAARHRALGAGCHLRLTGSPARKPYLYLQTVEGQIPAAGARARTVTLSINPVCHGEERAGLPREPFLKPGPTELISGLFAFGGESPPNPGLYSSPGCLKTQPEPGGSTVEVLNPATGAVIATQTVTSGHFVEIPLPPGVYTIAGGAGIGFLPQTYTVEIPAGYSVRQDFVIPAP